MQEDTKPENDDIQDEERKTPFSRSEYHGVITSYAGLALSLIAIILSVITMYQSHMMETREIVQILRAEDDGYYHFDGEKLFKNFQVTVANNSAIPVSVVEITIERDGEARTFEVSDLPDDLPLNMESNYTKMVTIPWTISLSEEDAQTIRDCVSDSESDRLLSSRPAETQLGAIDSPTTEEEALDLTSGTNTGFYISHALLNSEEKPPSATATGWVTLRFRQYELKLVQELRNTLQSLSENLNQKSLSVTVSTSKKNDYMLTATDWKGVWENSEGTWVATSISSAQKLYMFEQLREARMLQREREREAIQSEETPTEESLTEELLKHAQEEAQQILEGMSENMENIQLN